MIDVSQRVTLGSSSVRVSRVGVGMHAVGTFPSGGERQAHDLVTRAIERGINLIDTAPVYGQGAAERRLGEALMGLDRGSVVISTKVGYLIRPIRRGPHVRGILREGLHNGTAGYEHLWRNVRKVPAKVAARLGLGAGRDPWASVQATANGRPLGGVVDFSYEGVMRSIEESLGRLATDRIDIALLHDPEMHVREVMDGAYRALDRLRGDGTVGAIGIGINYAAPAVRFAKIADLDCILIAGRYTLLDQVAAEELFPLAASRGISILAAGVFNSGILADPSRHPFYDYVPASRRRIDRARRFAATALRCGVPLRAAALQFTASHPAVSSLILGSPSAMALDESLEHLGHPIPKALWDDLRAQGLLDAHLPTPS